MKLLIFTQKVDLDDPVLSFFHRWIIELAKHFDKIIIVCLYKGRYDLPTNVQVFSLGKELGKSRVVYLCNFYRLIIRLRNEYNAVFAHQNQEYPILGGIIWKLLGKRVYMWRNHYAGSILTDISAMFCDKVFCTSKFSYTAKYKKTVLMPVGVDTVIFRPDAKIKRILRSVLFFARVAPSKKPDIFIEALGILKRKSIVFSATLCGNSLPADATYYESLKMKARDLDLSNFDLSDPGLGNVLKFSPGVSHDKAPAIYSAHEIFINLSPSGMYDKTIFEAMACGCMVMASSEDLKNSLSAVLKNRDDSVNRFIFNEGDATDLAGKIEGLLFMSTTDKTDHAKDLRVFVDREHSLAKLGCELAKEMDSL